MTIVVNSAPAPILLRQATTQPIGLVQQGPRGPQGAPGDNFRLAGSAPTYADLPTTLDASSAGQAWMTNSDGRVYVWSGTAWPPEGQAPVLQGPAGVDGTDGKDGQIRFVGNGAPGTVVGASPGDQYLDRDTGDIYALT